MIKESLHKRIFPSGEYDPQEEYEEDWPGFPQIPERDSKVGIYDDLDPGERKSVKFTINPEVYLRLGPAGDLEGYHAYRTDESEAVDEELETDPGVVICGYDGEEGAREAKLVVRGIPTLANSSRYERYLKITNRQKILMAEAGSEPVAVEDSSYPLEGNITEDKTFTVTASGTWGGDDYAAIELVIRDTVTEEEGASDRVRFIMLETDLDADINGDTYFTEDDPEETEGLGLVVSVNDDDDGNPEGVDCGNEVIDTPDDRDDMKMLKLRRLKPYFLMSGTVRLTVDNTGKIRIFDLDGRHACRATTSASVPDTQEDHPGVIITEDDGDPATGDVLEAGLFVKRLGDIDGIEGCKRWLRFSDRTKVRIAVPGQIPGMPGESEIEIPGDIHQDYELEIVQNGTWSAGDSVTVELFIKDPSGFELGYRDRVRFVKVEVDLEFDSLPEETDPGDNEENPGGFICVNDDDDDGEPGIDRDRPVTEPALATADSDLKRLKISMYPVMCSGTVTLTAPSGLRVWKSQNKEELVTGHWNLGVPAERQEFESLMTDDVWVEGVEPGIGDLVLSWGGMLADRVKMSVLEVRSIEYKRATETEYRVLRDDTLLLQGQVFDFKAIVYPDVGFFPPSIIEWSGTFGVSGRGEAVSHAFADIASCSSSDYKTVVACNKSINTIVSDKVLGIHSNADPDGSITQPMHAWVSITDYGFSPATIETYGLWHSSVGPSFSALYAPDTDLYVDLERSYTPNAHNRYYVLRPLQFYRFQNWLDEGHNFSWSGTSLVPPTYDCASFASDTIVEIVGEDIDADDILGFETPRQVSRSIDDLEATDPTTADNPALAGSGSSGGGSSWVWP